MTEEKLVERVTALFADSDAAQRKMIRLYAETNDAIEASAIIDSGAEVLHMLQGGLRPEVLVLDSVLSDTTIFPLLRSIRQQQIEYEPHIIVTLMPSAAPQIEKILTLGAECTIFKPYSLPELFDTVYQTAASGPRLNRYLVHESVTAQLRTLGCYKNLALWYQLPAGSRVYCGLQSPGVFPGGVVHQSRGAVWRKWPGGALGSGTPECTAVQKQYAGLPDAVRAQRQDPAGTPDGK